MIRFSCPGCGRKFNVPDNYAGKKANCKKCGQMILVPDPRARADEPEPPMARMPAPPVSRLPVRTRRLMADLREMREAFTDGPLIRILETTGDPAESYKMEFNIRGVESLQSQKPVIREQHIAEIRLISDYPRLSPACRMITPIFHPNIDDSAICMGDHWAAGEHLTDLVIRIGQMIAYQAYNIKSPLNGEAAMWADLNPESFPIDSRDLYPAMAV
jgi:ubiquitin-protein ligase/DNA-directed RNA polymerase subunit RPC12/RpoP